MDDKSFGKGWNKYATVVSDGERGHVLDLTEGRDEKSASALVERLFPKEVRDRIETMTTDLGWAYIRLHRNLLSKALLIHDRFHLVQLLNRALNDLRKREVNQNPNLLKGSRYALLKNPENRTEKQEVIFQAIMDSTLKVGILWQLRESFKAIFRCSSPAEAMTYLKLWLARARETGIQQADRVANTFEKHLDGVCNALYCEQSNARAERHQWENSTGHSHRKRLPKLQTFPSFRPLLSWKSEPISITIGIEPKSDPESLWISGYRQRGYRKSPESDIRLHASSP